MKNLSLGIAQPYDRSKSHVGLQSMGVWFSAVAFVLGLATSTAAAQNAAATADKPEKVVNGYAIHQTTVLGGHIADHSGSPSMWDTLVNTRSGPRILNFSLNMRSVDPVKTLFFDSLSTSNYGYGGDPFNTTMLRMSKGRIYDFTGSFRRDRQYFDYDLLGNPLIPSTAVPYAPLLTSPHLFNTVRRMSDVDLTLMPLSKVSFRVGYSQNVAEGPSFSSVHTGADALLSQWWRNSTGAYRAGIDFRLAPKTVLSYDQYYTFFKGDTNWKLTGLDYQLANGTPVSMGIDIFSTAANTCLLPGTANTIKPVCSGYTGYTRSLPTRTTFPTEQFRFVSTSLDRVSLNGRLVYSGATGDADRYSEINNGLTTRTAQQAVVDTGNGANGRLATTKRVSVNGDIGTTVQLTEKVSITDVFDFWAFRVPGQNDFTEVSTFAPSLTSVANVFDPATCPPPYTAATCPQHTPSSGADTLSQQNYRFLGQNTKTNTISANWEPIQKFKVSVGYRYRDRRITTSSLINTFELYTPKTAARGDCAPVSGLPNPNCTFNANGSAITNKSSSAVDVIPIHEHWGLFGLFLQPTNNFRMNVNVDAMYADNSYTRISPRQLQHYRVRANYKPKQWMNFSGALNVFESRNNVDTVNYLHHARDYSFGTSIAPGKRWGVDLGYSFQDVYSRVAECYVATPAPGGAPACLAAGVPYLLSDGAYNQPTQFGSVGINLSPVKRVHTNFGYRMSAVDGNETRVNARQVAGSLQSQYQQPYADLAFDLAPQWTWKANWNYYSYGEGSPIGPTSPRSFRGNVYTLGVKYSF